MVIIALIIAMTALVVGYASLRQVIKMKTKTTNENKWLVEITKIEESEMIGATTKGDLRFNETSATLTVDLAYPGASATYDITLANHGTMDAVLESISGLDTANNTNPTQIQYEIIGIGAGDLLVAKNGDTIDTQVAKVKVTWMVDEKSPNISPTEPISKTATITLNYVQNIKD